MTRLYDLQYLALDLNRGFVLRFVFSVLVFSSLWISTSVFAATPRFTVQLTCDHELTYRPFRLNLFGPRHRPPEAGPATGAVSSEGPNAFTFASEVGLEREHFIAALRETAQIQSSAEENSVGGRVFELIITRVRLGDPYADNRWSSTYGPTAIRVGFRVFDDGRVVATYFDSVNRTIPVTEEKIVDVVMNYAVRASRFSYWTARLNINLKIDVTDSSTVVEEWGSVEENAT